MYYNKNEYYKFSKYDNIQINIFIQEKTNKTQCDKN